MSEQKNDPRRPGRSIAAVAFLLTLFFALQGRAAATPLFLLEEIEVEGASRAAAHIVVAESQLRTGSSYDENALRQAMARIQRLPFVVSAGFRLQKGSSVGRFVLLIEIRASKPLFVEASRNTRWTDDFVKVPVPGGLDYKPLITQRTTSEVAVGLRGFAGARGVFTAVAQRREDRNDRYTLSFSQYDLFQTRASLTALVSYLNDPGVRGPTEGMDWHVRDNLTWELIGVVPLSGNESIRASWQWSQLPIRHLAPDPDSGQLRPVLRSLREMRSEVFFIHDSTDDPLFPSSGLRITAGAIRTSMPTSSLLLTGRRRLDELRASLEASHPLTARQAVSIGGSASDYDQSVRDYRLFGRYATDLWGRERTRRDGDLRFELIVDREFSRVHTLPQATQSVVSAGLAFRNVWGVVRLTAEYSGGEGKR